jgi:hypothetical protein
VNPVTDLTRAWQGLAMTVAGDPKAADQFNSTWPGLAIALGWFLLALVLSAAAQSVVLGMPSPLQMATGLFIQGMAVGVLAFVTVQSLRFLALEIKTITLLVPVVYFMALVQVLAIPLTLLGPNAQIVAVVGLALLIWRAGITLGGMRSGIAIAYALLCVMVLVVVPNALYMLFLASPSPA